MIIPADVSGIKAKLKAAFTNPQKKVDPAIDAAKQRHDGSDAAKERAKRKALAEELANEKTTAARKQEIIDGLQAQLDTAQAELEEHKSKVEELTPEAKAWKAYEHKKRQQIISDPPVHIAGHTSE